MEQISDMIIEQEDKVLIEEGASHYFNYIAVGGTISLTRTHLSFVSRSGNRYNHQLKIKLSEISRVEYFKTMMINPNGLALKLKNNTTEHFIFDDRAVWYKRISELIGEKTENN